MQFGSWNGSNPPGPNGCGAGPEPLGGGDSHSMPAMGALEKMKHNGQIVYVVDDEKVIADTLAMILSRSGFAAKGFHDPLDVLKVAEQNGPPDLLIADVMMPGMTGIDLAIRVRQAYPDCRVLLFSGKADTSDLLETARRQGYDFELLSKPVYPADLLERIEAQMRNNGKM